MYSKKRNKQLSLKPQDLLVALKVAVTPNTHYTYAQLAGELFMSASEVHASVGRAEMCHLLRRSDEGLTALVTSLDEFIIHGISFVFPAIQGTISRGMPTGISGPVLKNLFAASDNLAMVWPDPQGDSRGISILPIFPSVPNACRVDQKLYEVLSLIDAIRAGSARERELAQERIPYYFL